MPAREVKNVLSTGVHAVRVYGGDRGILGTPGVVEVAGDVVPFPVTRVQAFHFLRFISVEPYAEQVV